MDWVGEAMSDLPALVDRAELEAEDVGADDAPQLRATVPEILEVLTRLLSRVHAGELVTGPGTDGPSGELSGEARGGWL